MGRIDPDRRTFGVEVGRQYLVFGMEFRQCIVWVQVEVAPNELISAPMALFDLTDPTVPDLWEASVADDGGLTLWPAALKTPGFHERILSGDPVATKALERLRRLLESPASASES